MFLLDEYQKFRDTVLKYDYSYGTGVSVFADNRITMRMNEYGEYKPHLKEYDNNEVTNEKIPLSLIEPMMDESPDESVISKELYGNIQGINFHSRLGYYSDLYAGYVNEGQYRQSASSGGVGTWILKELFEKDLIDGAIHVKENNDSSSSILFKYDISTSVDEIIQGAKTKYYPVELSEVLKKVKETPGRYAIVGLPAFIFSVRLLAKQDPVIRERIKYSIGLVCGHLKSARFADSLAWQLGIKPGEIESIDFRKKLEARPAHRYGIEVTGRLNGKSQTVVKPMKELVGDNWGQGFFKVNASDYTDDVMNETADITIGDAWLDEYTADSRGTNIVLVRNQKISELIKNALSENRLIFDEIDEEKMVQSQASHFRHTQDELGYRLWMKDKKNVWRPNKRIEASNNLPFIRKKIQKQREVLAKASHRHFKTALERDDLDYFISKMLPLVKKYEKYYSYAYYLDQGFGKITKKVLKKVGL